MFEEERRLARRLAAVAQHAACPVVKHITSIKFSDPVVAQSGELTNRESAGFVTDQTQRQIQSLSISRVPII
jgi:uncharacterized lipoprotein YajG